MQRKLVKKNVYNAGKSSTNQELVFQHMSNHYRRILNAKKTVDTSPPYCYQKKKVLRAKTTTSSTRNIRAVSSNISPALTERSISTNSCKGSCWGTESYIETSRYHALCVPGDSNSNLQDRNVRIKCNCVNMDLINRITFDTKKGPAAYCDEGWLEIKAQHNDKSFKTSFKTNKNQNDESRNHIQIKAAESQQKKKYTTKENVKPSKPKASAKPNQITCYNKQSYSRVMKTETVSKLRSMRVYHPPRRIKNKDTPKINMKRTLENSNCECTNICICRTNEENLNFKKASNNPKESQTSSRDSAYNGGVSSLPESRSPTPEQCGKIECCCLRNERYFCSAKNSKTLKKSVKDVKIAEDLSSSGLESSREPCITEVATKNLKESLEKMKDDELYIKFIQDITVEVLEKCLYTNKGLIKVMKKHILKNIHILDKDRMMKEVDNLRTHIGIPENKSLLDFNVVSVPSSTSIPNLCPPISDSEFVMPKTLLEESLNNDLLMNMSEIITTKNSNGEVLFESESDDSETISVIQVGKETREKRMEKNGGVTSADLALSQGNSADESDQSSECPHRCANERTKNFFSFSSSENEESEKKLTSDNANDKTNDGRGIFSCAGKKNRSVSFRKNEHAGKKVESKETRTLCCSKRRNAQNEK